MEITNEETDEEEILNKEIEQTQEEPPSSVILQSGSEGFFFKAISLKHSVPELLNFALESFSILRNAKINKFPSYIQ